MDPSTEHDWIRKHLAAFVAGLLEPEEESRFRDHVSSCAECKKVLEKYSEGPLPFEADDVHIPSSVIARWDRARDKIVGLERQLVREHLERCGDCQQDLEILGFEPSLEYVPSLELESGLPETSAALKKMPDQDGYSVRIIKYDQRSSRWSWLRWPLVGWATVATAAALVLFAGIGRQSAPLHPVGDSIIPWVQPKLVRGPNGASTLTVPAGTTRLILPVTVPTGIARGAGGAVEVFAPNGSQILRTPVAGDNLERRTVMIYLSSSPLLEPGTYRVLFWKGDPALPSTQVVESRFEIQIPDSLE